MNIIRMVSGWRNGRITASSHRHVFVVGLAVLVLMVSHAAHAASKVSPMISTYEYDRAKVVATGFDSYHLPTTRILLTSGPDHGHTVNAGTTNLNSSSDIAPPTYHVGDIVVVTRSATPTGAVTYAVLDHYRLANASWLMVVIFVMAIGLARWRGLGSLGGLVLSLTVIGGYMVPQIIHGSNPYVVTLVGVGVISFLGIYLAHGFSRRTTLALISSYLTLGIAVGLSALSVELLRLSGVATEDIAYLHQQLPSLNISGLLLCGIIISLVGVLDDVTVGQSTAVEELALANTKLTVNELYIRGLRVGREHIASLINTLVLAYVGSSLLFVLYVAGTLHYPLWLTLNSEPVMEEVARALTGSFALMLAVPLSTYLAARWLRPRV